jgi:hypothetical protein
VGVENPRWTHGDAVLLRTIVPPGRVGMAMPMTIVADEEDLIGLYVAPGTVNKRRSGTRGGPRGRQLIEDTGRHEDWVWRGDGRLMLHRPGAGHAVSLFWREEDHSFLDWYVDVLEPLRRTPLGFDTRDLTLDVVIAPDRTWRLKDEDELAWSVEQEQFTEAQAAAIHAEAEHAIELFQAGDSLYTVEWVQWRPDPAWPIPQLPEGWDQTT